MPRQPLPSASRPVAWALLSQSLWLPLLAIDLHDRWQASVKAQAPRPGEMGTLREISSRPPAALGALPGPLAARNSSPGAGLVLSSGYPAGAGPASDPPSSLSGSTPAEVPLAPAGAPLSSSGLDGRPSGSAPAGLVQGEYSRSERLGGPITLADLQGPAVQPPLALAEQGRQRLSGDPMAGLPEAWREPMRQALKTLPTPGVSSARIETARHIHIPSRRVSTPTEVPLALQADGSVDILSRPKEEAVVEEIRDWSARQAPPPEGSVTPAVLHLHPLAEVETLRPPTLPSSPPLTP